MTDIPSIRVAINGYGVIGKRVADAILAQPDMTLVGVSDVGTDWRVRGALEQDIALYASTPRARVSMDIRGWEIAGQLEDLLSECDVVVDATPKGVGAANMEVYQDFGVRVVLQGGEAHEVTGHSFVAQANYESAMNRPSTRVVSCNTTSTVRTLGALRAAGLLRRARGVLIRRATDPWESDHTGIMNTLVPEPKIPSHQSPDAQTVLPDLDVVTMAVKASHTQSHQHFWVVDLTRQTTRDEILEIFEATPRIAMMRTTDGFVAVNSTHEFMKDLGRPRGDMWEVGLWEDILKVEGDQLLYTYQVDNQAIVVPETIDAIRALMGTTPRESSMARTDSFLGVRDSFLDVKR